MKLLKVKYNPNIFDPVSIEHAKQIILLDPDVPNQWETETEWTMNLFREKQLFNEKSVVLDWGCGIGRLAKPIIEEYNCKVIGVDFQGNMLKYAKEYVNHPNFTAISNEEFHDLPDDYFTVGIAIWALQHAIEITSVLRCIQKKLKSNGEFAVLNLYSKSVPVKHVEPKEASDDDIIIADVLLDEKDAEFCLYKNPYKYTWYVVDEGATAREISNYFSAKEITQLSSKKEKNIVLSKHIDISWMGIFLNDKKNYYYPNSI